MSTDFSMQDDNRTFKIHSLPIPSQELYDLANQIIRYNARQGDVCYHLDVSLDAYTVYFHAILPGNAIDNENFDAQCLHNLTEEQAKITAEQLALLTGYRYKGRNRQFDGLE